MPGLQAALHNRREPAALPRIRTELKARGEETAGLCGGAWLTPLRPGGTIPAMQRSPITLTFAFLVMPCLLSAGPQTSGRRGPLTLAAVIGAEAARARTPEQLDLLKAAARDGVLRVRCAAVRALGRLERPALVPELALSLSAASSEVRAEAAHSLAQAAGQDLAASASARAALLARLPAEHDPEVRAAVCEALGRLAVEGVEDMEAIERVLRDETARVAVREGMAVSPASPLVGIRIGWGSTRPTATASAVGALRGLESFLRLRGKVKRASPETVGQLRWVAATAVMPARRLALLALNVAAAADAATLERAMADEEAEVRRLAVASPTASLEHIRRGLADRAPAVRYEALRAYGRRFQAQEGCVPVAAASRDLDGHVALLALDLLGNACRAGEKADEILLSAIAGRGTAPRAAEMAGGRGEHGAWYRPAHAIVSLARVLPERAAALLGTYLSAEPWQLRMYAARAAAILRDVASLTRLAADRDANVREAAIAGLANVQQHAADAAYLDALQAGDGQLVMTAARALKGTPGREAATARVMAALERWTAADSDTSRDPRLALLERLEEVGTAASAPGLLPLLRDADPRVAARAAALLSGWTGTVHEASPRVRPPQAVPSERELSYLSRSVVRLTMRGGRRIDIRLLTDLAPLSCARFARLAADGYYTGLTFHRVVPNFLVQGGSPGANEFAGDSRFMLDEVGRATQARGTVGNSTRGRDTGDAQFYINLVDNTRLDHDYTIFGEVVSGMDVVDGILEGDVIERAEVVAGKGRRGGEPRH